MLMGVEQGMLASITALGMATPLAPNLFDSCAAARAGITRTFGLKTISLSDAESLGQEPIAGSGACYIAQGFVGLAKALLLGKAALDDLQSRITLNREELRRAGIFVNVADHFYPDSDFHPWMSEDPRLPSERWAEQCKQLIPSLLRSCRLDFIPEDNRRH